MKKYLHIIMLLFMGVCVMPLTSCSGDDDDDTSSKTSDPANDWGSLKSNGYAGTGAAVDIYAHSAVIQCSINKEFGPAYAYTRVDISSNSSFSHYYSENSGALINGEKYTVTFDDLKPNTTYYYRSSVKVGNMEYVGDVRTFKTEELTIKTSGYVDFGEYGKWAACNLGASKPSDKGGTNYSPFPFPYYEGMTFEYDEIYSNWQGTSKDAATASNSSLITPTDYEMSDILTDGRVYIDAYNYNGVNGYAITPKNKQTNEAIFLPYGKYVMSDAYCKYNHSYVKAYLRTIDESGFDCQWFELFYVYKGVIIQTYGVEVRGGMIRPMYK